MIEPFDEDLHVGPRDFAEKKVSDNQGGDEDGEIHLRDTCDGDPSLDGADDHKEK